MFGSQGLASWKIVQLGSFTQEVWERILIHNISFLSGFREEYRPWIGVQPSKLVQKRPTFLATATSVPPPETSYQAAFNADTHRHSDISVMDMSTHSQPNIPEMAGRAEVSSRPEVSRSVVS